MVQHSATRFCAIHQHDFFISSCELVKSATHSFSAISGFSTQDTVEGDSFNNTYDENATYPVVNVTELKEALTNGGIWYTVVAE